MIDSLPPIPPALILIAGALLVPLFRGTARSVFMLLLPVLGFLNLLVLPDGQHFQFALFGDPQLAVVMLRVDSLSLPFGVLFHIAALVGIIYALHLKDTIQHVAALMYAGSALGAVYAGDVITLFVFWELLAFTSVFLIWARREPDSGRAGMRYFIAQLASGMLLLNGIVIQALSGGSLTFEAMTDNLSLTTMPSTMAEFGALCFFLAFGVKCAFPLLHNWLVDGYPAATPTGAVFLCGFTTKVAVYALARGFPGAESLITIGTVMAMFPIFYAVIENDLRRVLGYSMINQLGFMVVGIGLGTDLGLNGAVAHAFNDVFFKGVLFMAMGAVLFRTGTINGSELGGLYKTMPKTAGFCMVGAASISAFPLFSGFVSKSMIMVSAAEEHQTACWFFLLFAAAGVFHHAGIKIPFFAFFAHDSGKRPKEAPLNMLIAMGIASAICVFNGCYPWLLYDLLPRAFDYNPYDSYHVITQLQLLFYSALAFTLLKLTGLYPPELRSVNLDFDWFYRRATRLGGIFITGPLASLGKGIGVVVGSAIPRAVGLLPVARDFRLPGLPFLDSSVLVVILMLLSYLLFNYFW